MRAKHANTKHAHAGTSSLIQGRRSLASLLLQSSWVMGIRAALEHFDGKGTAVLFEKGRKKWDAIRQLIRYRDVVGRETPISVETIRNGELFVDTAGPSE